MFDLICKLFIKNYDDIENSEVREKYGIVISIFSIVCNCLMVGLKLFISFVTNSVSIRADALNNLSDVGSNLATLFGFKLANKHADADHPYGHGRMEYVSGMVVSFLILLVGFEAFKESLVKIIHPESIQTSSTTFVVLIISIGIKLLMGYINKKGGDKINSQTLLAASQDSVNDSMMTGATLVCVIIFVFTNINLDAYVGAFVSVLVIKSGIGIFKEVLTTILGQAPDRDEVNEIIKYICTHQYVLGVHDLMLHDYGPSNKFLSVHVEVDANNDIMHIHDEMDNIESDILEKYGILTTIHMDPIDTKDKEIKVLRVEVNKLVNNINSAYTIHDFRMVRGTTHTNLVFDVLIPAGDEVNHEELKKKVNEVIKENLGQKYNCVLHIDHDFT